jgi:prevent-host-death family protein
MRTVKVGKLKNQLSAYLRYVKNGEEVLVQDRDTPVAKIVPVSPPDPSLNDYEAEEAYLIAIGQMRPPIEEIDKENFWKLPMPEVPDKAVKEALDWVRGK